MNHLDETIQSRLNDLTEMREHSDSMNYDKSARQEHEMLLSIEETAKRKDVFVYDVKKYSNHPDDFYLAVVVCELFNDWNTPQPFVTWVFNSFDKGFSSGHYFETIGEAFDDFVKRGIQ